MILLRECFSLMMGKCRAMPVNNTIPVTGAYLRWIEQNYTERLTS
jgi:hypothetical protein